MMVRIGGVGVELIRFDAVILVGQSSLLSSEVSPHAQTAITLETH